jgi:redox-sensitive bicupin YhaK (pirin superfamily)
MLDLVIEERRRDLGGFEVGRVLPFAKRRMIGPYVFFDHMGPIALPADIPRSIDVRPHPHIGLSTLTYLFSGEITHRDSVGSCQDIRPGEVNWMTAGRGITHSERFDEARRHGVMLHGIQAWVALPDRDEETDPSFSHHVAGALPVLDDKGVWGRLVAGSAFGLTAPVKTYSPQFYIHCVLEAGSRFALPKDHAERAAYIVEGTVMVDGQSHAAGRMLVFGSDADVVLLAETQAVLMILGGTPIGPRFIDWNFVSSSKERIEQAKADWRAGRMKLPDLDDAEFIPLPEMPEPVRPGAGSPTS